jgi:hypothetical protein
VYALLLNKSMYNSNKYVHGLFMLRILIIRQEIYGRLSIYSETVEKVQILPFIEIHM